jgi:hypothetical protein
MNGPEATGAAVLAVLLLATVLTACLGDEGRRNSARHVLAMLLCLGARTKRHDSGAGLPKTDTSSVTTTITQTKSITVTTVKTHMKPKASEVEH